MQRISGYIVQQIQKLGGQDSSRCFLWHHKLDPVAMNISGLEPPKWKDVFHLQSSAILRSFLWTLNSLSWSRSWGWFAKAGNFYLESWSHQAATFCDIIDTLGAGTGAKWACWISWVRFGLMTTWHDMPTTKVTHGRPGEFVVHEWYEGCHCWASTQSRACKAVLSSSCVATMATVISNMIQDIFADAEKIWKNIVKVHQKVYWWTWEAIDCRTFCHVCWRRRSSSRRPDPAESLELTCFRPKKAARAEVAKLPVGGPYEMPKSVDVTWRSASDRGFFKTVSYR